MLPDLGLKVTIHVYPCQPLQSRVQQSAAPDTGQSQRPHISSLKDGRHNQRPMMLNEAGITKSRTKGHGTLVWHPDWIPPTLTNQHGKPDATRVYPYLLTLPQGPTVWFYWYGGNLGAHTGDKMLSWQTAWPTPTDAQRSRNYQIENGRLRDTWSASQLDVNTDKLAWETWRHSSLVMTANITTGSNGLTFRIQRQPRYTHRW